MEPVLRPAPPAPRAGSTSNPYLLCSSSCSTRTTSAWPRSLARSSADLPLSALKQIISLSRYYQGITKVLPRYYQGITKALSRYSFHLIFISAPASIRNLTIKEKPFPAALWRGVHLWRRRGVESSSSSSPPSVPRIWMCPTEQKSLHSLRMSMKSSEVEGRDVVLPLLVHIHTLGQQILNRLERWKRNQADVVFEDLLSLHQPWSS